MPFHILLRIDNGSRYSMNGLVFEASTPDMFRQRLQGALRRINGKSLEHRLVFPRSWNEWADGKHAEPDLRFGRTYLEASRSEFMEGNFMGEVSTPTEDNRTLQIAV